MPHKKKKQKRHRRRVGAFSSKSKDIGIKVLAVGAGILLGKTLNGFADKVLPKTTDPVPVPTKNAEMLATAGELGIGALLLLRRQSGPIGLGMKVAGGLLAGAGIRRALKIMGVIGGYQSIPVIGRHPRMAGYQSVPVIGGSVPGQLSGGIPAQLRGYVPAGSGVGSYVSQGSGVMGGIGSCDAGSSGISNTGSGYLS
jgi:hypothetical protein